LKPAATPSLARRLSLVVLLCAVACALAPVAPAQITVNSKTGAVTNDTNGTTLSTVDRRYQQITPTNVPLTKSELDPKTRLEVLRIMQAEQGFAMRPFPRGHKGLTLAANGKLEPAGEGYIQMVTSQGLSANPGDRLIVTDVKFDRNKIIFDLNGGPDPRHRFLRHVEIGGGPMMNPVVPTDEKEPVGSRLTLTFENHVPELTGKDVKALLAPLISFDVKSPIQAYTDTLPTKLKDAILDHHVLVGMSTDMLLFAKGAPDTKSREMDGQMPFEEWIYGKPPQEVDFVRVNGNRVIRVEVAKVGVPPVIFDKDEVEGLMRTDGTPIDPEATQRVAKVGDVQRDPEKQAPAAPPSLRNPGEKLPQDDPSSKAGVDGVMRPVQFPKPHPDPNTTAHSDSQPASKPAAQSAAGQGTPPPPAQPTPQPSIQPGANPDGVPDPPAVTASQPATPDASQQAPPPGSTHPQLFQPVTRP